MSNVALLYGDIVIYWNEIIIVLGLLAGCIFAFVLRSFTLVKKGTLLFCLILTFILSFFFSRVFYFYCQAEKFVSLKDSLTGNLTTEHCVIGLILGVILSALIAGFASRKKCVKKLLDTVFPGAILALSIIRFSYYFTDTWHSRIEIHNKIFQRLPFAIKATDAAGNTSFVFAPFFISAILLFLIVFVITLLVRKKIKRTGEMFLLTFIFFALTEMVLESTRNDALKLHFIFLKSLNKYISFICFTMFVLGIILIVVFFVNYKNAVRRNGHRKNIFPLIMFILAFICFGVCEYLVQRYTSQLVLFHWIQAGFAVIMAVNTVLVVHQRKAYKSRRKSSRQAAEVSPASD